MRDGVVRDTSDARQVKYARRLERRREQLFRASLRAVMSTEAGRAVCWDFISRAGVFHSIWDNSARIHYNAGRQDFGHEMMAEVLETDEALYLLMEQEARNRLKKEQREVDATHTAATSEVPEASQ